MIKVSREEILYIAKLSRIAIHEDEIESLVDDISQVLNYAARVQELAATEVQQPVKNINIFREDTIVQTDPQPLIAQAPQREEQYYVVPAVLDSEK